jgi:tetratricopeptide (TPR) repeat protein
MGRSGTGGDGLGGEGPADVPRGNENELSGTVYGSAVQAGTIHGDIHFHGSDRQEFPGPCQLPPVPPHFTNRSTELAALMALSDTADLSRPTLAVIMGVGGSGKTALALRWLAELRERFPDGQLYADLAGHRPGSASRPLDVVGGFLRAMGLPPGRVPISMDEAAALWRSVTAGRSLIVFLDNAASAAQVRVLLPGSGPTLVAVTSRYRLSGLAIEGARFVELEALSEPDAVELLARIAGNKAHAEPDAARAVVRLCGNLPLAVCVSAARLAANPRWRVQRIADELASEQDRLAALSLTEDLSVRAAFDVSYRALPREAARAYRLLALVPGPDFTADLAAAATATRPNEMAGWLDALTGASLLQEAAEGRFRFHDLVRLHAREQAETDPECRPVVQRAVTWYLQAAVAADLVVIPGRWQLGPSYAKARQARPGFAGPAEALAWLEAELPGLMATVLAAREEGFHGQAWQLCEALWGLFLYRRHYPLWITATQAGLASARACADLRAEARMADQLGFAYLCLRRYTDAQEHFTQAMTRAREAGDPLGEAAPLEHLGITLLGLGRPGSALGLFTTARETHVRLGRPRGIALMTRHIGEAHADAGEYAEAITALLEARRGFASLPDRYNEARTVTLLAQAYLHERRPADAAALLGEALEVMNALSARDKQAGIHVLLADVADDLGDLTEAREHLAQARAIYEDLGAIEAEQVRRRQAAYEPDPPPPDPRLPDSHSRHDQAPSQDGPSPPTSN